MELKDVGRVMGETAMPAMPEKGKGKKSYPTLYLDNAPEELMSKEVGHVCRLTILVKVKGHSVNDGPDGERKTVDLEVQKVGYASPGQKTKDEYLNMDEKAKTEYEKSQLEADDAEESDNGDDNEAE